VARVAVVSGTATAVSGRVARRQAAKFEQKDQQAYDEQAGQQPPSEQQQPAYQEPAPTEVDDAAAQIRQLAALRDQGLLTEEEFGAKKKQILGI